MTVKIGWTLERPRPAAHTGRTIGPFQYFSVKKGDRGRVFMLGVVTYERKDLELLQHDDVVCDVRAIGALRFAADVTPRLVDKTIGKVRVTGPIFASDEVKRALRAHIGNGSSSDAST